MGLGDSNPSSGLLSEESHLGQGRGELEIQANFNWDIGQPVRMTFKLTEAYLPQILIGQLMNKTVSKEEP